MISILTTIAISSSLLCTAYAQSPNVQDEIPTDLTDIVVSGGEATIVSYHLEDGAITYAEFGDDDIVYIGEDIWVNGTLAATITSDDSDLEHIPTPYGSWTSQSTPAYGSPSDYNVYTQTIKRNLSLTATIATIGVGSLVAILVPYVGIPAAAENIAYQVITFVTGAFSAYASSRSLYTIEEYYNHYQLPQFYKMVKHSFYYNSQYTDEVPNSRKTVYQYWT